MKLCSSCSGTVSSKRKASVLTTIKSTVTTGVVERGVRSLSGIMAHRRPLDYPEAG